MVERIVVYISTEECTTIYVATIILHSTTTIAANTLSTYDDATIWHAMEYWYATANDDATVYVASTTTAVW
jgi:hypothetical protein